MLSTLVLVLLPAVWIAPPSFLVASEIGALVGPAVRARSARSS